jgi:hypothetical protein
VDPVASSVTYPVSPFSLRIRSIRAGEDGVARPQRVGSEDPAGAECVGEGSDAPVVRPLVSGNTIQILFSWPFSPRSTLSAGRFTAISTATQARSRSRRAPRRRRTDTGGSVGG